jgi:hypothetical protein
MCSFSLYGNYPPSRWAPGEIVPDRISVPVSKDAPDGVYHIFVGMYAGASGQRVPLWAGERRLAGDTFGLADVTVTATP